MKNRKYFGEFNLPQLISLATFILAMISVWVHMEVRIAEINVEVANLKQDIQVHKSDNRRDFELLRSEYSINTKEILMKVDEIQVYLKKGK